MLHINTVAYGSVVLGGLALFALGHPKGEDALPAATPGLTVAAAPAPAPVLAAAPAASVPAVPAVQAAAAPPATAPAAALPAPVMQVAAAPPAPASTTPAAPVPAATSVSGNGFTLASLSVDLPGSDRAFPPGPGVETAQANCAACHSVGMVLNQPALSRATWEAEVHKMIAVYKAPVSEEDAKTIVAYLDAIKGAK